MSGLAGGRRELGPVVRAVVVGRARSWLVGVLLLATTVGLPADLVEADDPRFRYQGRFHWQTPKEPEFGLAGTQILARFTGDSVAVRLRDNVGSFTGGNNAYYAIVNDDFSTRVLIRPTNSAATTWPVASGLGPGPHTFRLMRIGSIYSASSTFLGLELAAGADLVAPPAPAARRIEFWGDSVTEGSFQEDPTWIDAIDTNHWIAYGTKTARRLGADYVAYSRSGLGLWAGYQLPAVLSSTYSARYRGDLPPWDFVRHAAPHILVVNIGQNDFWTNTGAANAFIRERYANLVRLARLTYPHSTVVVAVGSMSLGSTTDTEALRWQAQIEGAVLDARAAGDARVHYLRFPRMAPTPTDDNNSRHPQDADTEVMAAQLEAFLAGLGPDLWLDGPLATRHEAEALVPVAPATAPAPTMARDPGSHAGQHLVFAASAVGQKGGVFLPPVTAGWYQVEVWMRRLPSNGIVQISLQGQALGTEIDLYRPSTNSLLQVWARAEGTVYLPAGTHALEATVTGRNASSNGVRYGFTLDSVVVRSVGPPPVVEWASPAAGTQPVGLGGLALTARSTPGAPAGAAVERVELFVVGGSWVEPTLLAAPWTPGPDGLWSFVWASPPVPTPTTYRFIARAVATDGAVAVSSPTAVTLTNNPPQVSLTSPAAGSRYVRGSSIPLTVTTSDADGSVADIRYERGTTRITNRTVPPFSATWSNVASGLYSLRAVATDNLTARTNSVAHAVTVAPPEPTGLAAVASEARVDLSWAGVSGTGVTYRVRREPEGGGAQVELGVTAGNTPSWTDATAVPGVAQRYTVTAIENGAESLSSPPVVASAWTGLQAWRAARWNDPNGTGLGADGANPDGDAWINLLEYALGLDPNAPDGAAAVVQGWLAGRLRLGFQRTARSDVRFAVEVAEGPTGPWIEIWSSSGQANLPGWVEVEDPVPPSVDQPRAIRLVVTPLSPGG